VLTLTLKRLRDETADGIGMNFEAVFNRGDARA
jgi:hypothetical protein